ncbi:hypothetical protein F4678DRAFT_459820 [Xylaria arbuscula]|nr:hypothetical protein F4678DRAFT_459820 [Xylaria arbuscula]
MSQKGGTYPVSPETARGTLSEPPFRSPAQEPGNLETKGCLSTHKTTSEKASHLDESNSIVGREWELVNTPDESEGVDSSTNCFEHHCEWTIGRGQWKFTLFSWDIKIRRPQSEDRGSS